MIVRKVSDQKPYAAHGSHEKLDFKPKDRFIHRIVKYNNTYVADKFFQFKHSFDVCYLFLQFLRQLIMKKARPDHEIYCQVLRNSQQINFFLLLRHLHRIRQLVGFHIFYFLFDDPSFLQKEVNVLIGPEDRVFKVYLQLQPEVRHQILFHSNSCLFTDMFCQFLANSRIVLDAFRIHQNFYQLL